MNHDQESLQQQLSALLQASHASGTETSEQAEADPMAENTEAVALLQRVAESFQQVTQNESLFDPGDAWGNLTIEKPIGQGGVGLVYQAFDHVLNRRVAVKFLQDRARLAVSSEQFINEARRLAQVRHPAVMAVFGAQTVSGITGFWSERLRGEPLSSMPLSDLDPRQKLQMMQQLATAVRAIQQKNMVHADIKPHNVMIEVDRGPVLMDFGAARERRTDADPALQSLTPLAMAPELFDGGSISRRSDVYALGIVYYFILSDGAHPHQADDFQQLKKQVTDRHQYPLGQRLQQPAGLKKLINQMCAFEPADRPDIDAVVHTLDALLAAPQKRLKRLALGSVLTFLLGSLLVLGVSFVQVNHQRQVAQQALQETQAINRMISEFVRSVSPSKQGKDVLLIDVLNQFKDELMASPEISSESQTQMLSNLASAQFFVGHHQTGMTLMNDLLSANQVSPMLQLEMQLEQARMIDYHPELSPQEQNQQLDQAIEAIQATMQTHDIQQPIYRAKLDFLLGRQAERRLEFETAMKHLSRALKYWQQQPPSPYSDLVQFTVLTSMGNVAVEQGQSSAAGSYYEQALAKAQKHTAIKFNGNLMVAFNNLTTHVAQTGDIQQAIAAFTTLLEQTQEFYGQDHPRTLTNVINLISAHNQAEQFEQAQQLIDQFKPTFAELDVQDSMLALHYLSASAIAQAGLNNLAAAEESYQQAITLSLASLGPEHPMTLTNQVNLAETHNLRKQHQKALDDLNGPMQLAQQLLGNEHVITVYMQQTQALAYFGLSQHEQAAKLMREVHQTRSRLLGADHPSSQQAQEYLAEIEAAQNKP